MAEEQSEEEYYEQIEEDIRTQYLWEQEYIEGEKQLQEDREQFPLFYIKEGIV